MATTTKYPHLSVDRDGNLRIGDSRYKVLHLAGEHYHYGWSAEELMRQHPDLRPEEVYAALAYFYDHLEELVPQLNAVVATTQPRSMSRAELLTRKSAQSP
jgi:uncharacterized protein (DUF433 family)